MKSLILGYESPRPLAAMRIVLCSVLLLDAIRHWPYCVELYSSAGVIMPLPEIADSQLASFSPTQAVIVHSLYVFFLASAIAGWWTRASLIAAGSILTVLSLIDYPLTLRKDTVISIHLLFLLALTRCDAVWSLDRRFYRQRGLDMNQPWATPLSPELSRRLMHVLIVSIYWGAAMTKFHMPDFYNGDLLEFSLLDERWGRPVIGHFLSRYPRLLAMLGSVTTMLEVCLPLLLLVPQTRRTGLLLATAFHIGLFLAMRLDGFSPVMLAALMSFLNEADFKLLSPLNRLPRREKANDFVWLRSIARRPANGGLFVIVGTLFATAGLAWQTSTDKYGAFGKRAETDFAQLSNAELVSVTTDKYPPAHQYFHSISLGVRTANQRAVGKTSGFQPGETVVVVGRLMRPHPDLGVICSLVDQERVIWTHNRQISEADSNFFLGVNLAAELAPGEYRIRLDVRNPLSATPDVLENVCSAAFEVTAE